MLRRVLPALAVALVLLTPAPAGAHVERPTEFPDGSGQLPQFRRTGPYLVVCKATSVERAAGFPPRIRDRVERLFERCDYRNIQAAVDHVRRRGTRILILPGVYREIPSLRPLSEECAALEGARPLSYEDQKRCPHVDNLITVFGDGNDEDRKCDGRLCDLQFQGIGEGPDDVVIDGRYRKLNVLRADRADGAHFRNFTIQRSEFNALYVLEMDGFVIDRVVGRWNDEYAFLAFTADHGLIKNCETYGNGDSGLYPGSAADVHHDRPSTEITGCESHHNLLGYSGTAGNSTYVHDNVFHHNSVGIVTDSFASGHPGMPQDAARFEDNIVYSNNEDYYRYWEDGTCDKPMAERGYEEGVVCPHFQAPIGVGILIAGGNENSVAGNRVYDNWRYGTMLFGVPATFRGEEDPSKEFDTSHLNTYSANVMGVSSTGQVLPNGLDFWWDEQGDGNCWEENEAAPEATLTSDPGSLPACVENPPPGAPFTPKQAFLSPCAAADPTDPDTWNGCDWFEQPPPPGGGSGAAPAIPRALASVLRLLLAFTGWGGSPRV